MNRLLSVVVVCATIVSAAARADDCHTTGYWATSKTPGESKMTVGSGVDCPMDFNLDSGFTSEATVTIPPQHGTVSITSRRSWSYRSNPGYSGPDFFQTRLNWVGGSGIEVNVHVTVGATAKIGSVEFGSGHSCSTWMQDRSAGASEYDEAWIAGYISGANAVLEGQTAGAGDLGSKSDLKGLMAWMDSYCRSNPSTKLDVAAVQLVNGVNQPP